MLRGALIRIPLLLIALVSAGTAPAHAADLPANIFLEHKRSVYQEPRPLARSKRSIVLKTRSWSRDIIDGVKDGPEMLVGSNGEPDRSTYTDLPWLDIDLMIELGDVSSYFEGVEVQYAMRRLLASAPCTDPATSLAYSEIQRDIEAGARKSCWQGTYEVALRTTKLGIKLGGNPSHWKPVTFTSPGDYVAVLDADETLLTQWFNPPGFRPGWFTEDGLLGVPSDFLGDKQSGDRVRFAPGAIEALLALRSDSHCKGIVLFSAKDDDALSNIYDNWTYRKDGKDKPVWQPLAIGKPPLIDAVFSRSHLTMSGDPMLPGDPNGQIARIPSKNLRIFDPKLEHVVIIDSNPSRIIPEQQYLLRAQPKFDSRRFAASQTERNNGQSNRFFAYYKRILELSVWEIIESAMRAEGNKFSFHPGYSKTEPAKMVFSKAFRPYSLLGRPVFDALKYSIPVENDDVGSKILNFTHIKPKLSGEKLEREALETARTNDALYEAAFDPL